MSESPTPQAPSEPTAKVEAVEPDSNENAELGDSGKKALQAEREARKRADKAVADLRAQLDSINAEKMSDLERTQQALAAAEKAAQDAHREALRFRLAAKHGINDEDAEIFLTGETEESMALQAERLVARAPEVKSPKPDLTQGGGGSTGVPALNSDELGDAVARAVGAK